ncbi:pyridoxamine kinase [Megasphaera butyrica]|uniref:pyridoxamine kinase n=1 Tax=Megasphaera butyrica TaxID=2981791 RepID=UPI000821DE7B|nr:pyridoxamine kinase [Megasphaera butyrica]MCU6714005.1 pyridoxamine kinase [Megasphaera butyrica]SCH32616.1 Pyridoxine kinase [uncultured Megasphaera sp.]SCI71017.1 Pyridoxine kinase [uncultured Ruminococcus sp.]
MKHQKKIALINDVTGYGRCSVAVELPIISALKIQACVLPTAILSVHTGFPTYYIDDYTDRMKPYMENWKENNLTFDGISTGFLGSVQQIELVLDFLRTFKKEGTTVIVDPVMGDYGKLYSSYTEELCRGMRHLLPYADVITPNLTEACRLLQIPYPEDGRTTLAELRDMAGALSGLGPGKLVITGIHCGEDIGNYIYERGAEPQLLKTKKIGSDRSGTGDVFAGIVSGIVVQGRPLTEAVRTAADFITKTMIYTEELDLPHNCGLAFEEFLTELK